ncbi:MAG: hypothetical protein V8S95_13940 [Odoribacter sp.]
MDVWPTKPIEGYFRVENQAREAVINVVEKMVILYMFLKIRTFQIYK